MRESSDSRRPTVWRFSCRVGPEELQGARFGRQGTTGRLETASPVSCKRLLGGVPEHRLEPLPHGTPRFETDLLDQEIVVWELTVSNGVGDLACE